MCGRYASTRSREDLLETFKIEEALADEETDPARQLRNLKWGLVPTWAKDPKIGIRFLCTSQVVGEDVSLRWV
jgi:putative SOS response-associated peptidase YedK